MHKNLRWITETAVMMALLVTLQALTKPAGQLLTGSCVNAVLAITVLVGGLSSGITVAIISPVLAYLLGIAPQILTVPAIMVGNTVFVVVMKLLYGETLVRKAAAWLLAAVAKFGVLWLLVSKIICGLLSAPLLESGMLKPPMLQALPATFSYPQLITALIGGAVALLVAPLVRKALHR